MESNSVTMQYTSFRTDSMVSVHQRSLGNVCGGHSFTFQISESVVRQMLVTDFEWMPAICQIDDVKSCVPMSADSQGKKPKSVEQRLKSLFTNSGVDCV